MLRQNGFFLSLVILARVTGLATGFKFWENIFSKPARPNSFDEVCIWNAVIF